MRKYDPVFLINSQQYDSICRKRSGYLDSCSHWLLWPVYRKPRNLWSSDLCNCWDQTLSIVALWKHSNALVDKPCGSDGVSSHSHNNCDTLRLPINSSFKKFLSPNNLPGDFVDVVNCPSIYFHPYSLANSNIEPTICSHLEPSLWSSFELYNNAFTALGCCYWLKHSNIRKWFKSRWLVFINLKGWWFNYWCKYVNLNLSYSARPSWPLHFKCIIIHTDSQQYDCICGQRSSYLDSCSRWLLWPVYRKPRNLFSSDLCNCWDHSLSIVALRKHSNALVDKPCGSYGVSSHSHNNCDTFLVSNTIGDEYIYHKNHLPSDFLDLVNSPSCDLWTHSHDYTKVEPAIRGDSEPSLWSSSKLYIDAFTALGCCNRLKRWYIG